MPSLPLGQVRRRHLIGVIRPNGLSSVLDRRRRARPASPGTGAARGPHSDRRGLAAYGTLTGSWRCALTSGVLTIAQVHQATSLYSIRISGHLGPTALSAFESMVSQLKGEDTLLTGVLDRSALYGVLAEIEALGLDLIELRRLDPRRIQGA